MPGANFPVVGVEVEQPEEGLVVEEGTHYSHIEESLPAAVSTVWLDIDWPNVHGLCTESTDHYS